MTIPSLQTVLLLQDFGGPERLVVAEAAVPEPGPGEVLVKILAASVQFTDVGVSSAIQGDIPFVRVGVWFAKLWAWNHFAGRRSTSFYSITKMRGQHPECFLADLGELLALASRGEIRPRVSERIGFDGVAEAHRRLERGGVEGKIVLLPNG